MYSEHPNGCNVLMGDGSVRFATMYINTYTWHASPRGRVVKSSAPINTSSREDPDDETVAHPARAAMVAALAIGFGPVVPAPSGGW